MPSIIGTFSTFFLFALLPLSPSFLVPHHQNVKSDRSRAYRQCSLANRRTPFESGGTLTDLTSNRSPFLRLIQHRATANSRNKLANIHRSLTSDDSAALQPLTYKVNKRSKFHGRPQFSPPVEIPAREEHTATIIYLHGFGSDGPGRGKDLPEMLNLPWVKFVVPIAPARRPFQIGQALQSWATIDPVNSITQQVQTIAGAAGKLMSGEAQVASPPPPPPPSATSPRDPSPPRRGRSCSQTWAPS